MANSINSYLGNSAAVAATGNSAAGAATGNSAASVTENSRTSQTSASQTSANQAPAVTPEAVSSESTQKVLKISSTAAQLASIGSTLSAQPAIDEAKVAQISKALANGTYTISADKIASGLMQSEQTLAQIGVH